MTDTSEDDRVASEAGAPRARSLDNPSHEAGRNNRSPEGREHSDQEEVSGHDDRAATERRLLAALCQNTLDRATRAEVLRQFAEHTFADPEHEVIFRALAKVPIADAERTRAELNVRITRVGFPDFDIDPFFGMKPPDSFEVATLLTSLKI